MSTTAAASTPSSTRATTLIHGHCLEALRTLPSGSIDCCITSPPYWGLRDYGTPGLVWGGEPSCIHEWDNLFCGRCGAWFGSLGLEPTPALYIEHLVLIFREVSRVLSPHGTLWLVLGDCFAGSWGSYGKRQHAPSGTMLPPFDGSRRRTDPGTGFLPPTAFAPGLKRKDLIGIPWATAFALRDAGWYLRSDVVWHKPNATPESVKDRPTRAHEFIFLLAKSPRYYYDNAAIAEPVAHPQPSRIVAGAPAPASALNPTRQIINLKGRALPPKVTRAYTDANGSDAALLRNRRSVWSLPTHAYRGAHFATYPPELIRPCIRAGCPRGGVVLDPFAGAGTTGLVAQQEGRRFIGIELNPQYLALAKERLGVSPLPSAA